MKNPPLVIQLPQQQNQSKINNIPSNIIKLPSHQQQLQLPPKVIIEMLTNDPTKMDSYNKALKAGQGTLIANWFEERIHRDEKGEARTLTNRHFQKKHDALYLSQGFQGKRDQDNTKYRVIGSTNYPLGTTQNYHYGKSKNKADTFQTLGKKTRMTEQMVCHELSQYLRQIMANLQKEQKDKKQRELQNQFESSYRNVFVAKDFDQNYIGRLIMRNQNGGLVSLQNVDEDLRQANKFRERGQISQDEELRKLIDIDLGYEKAEPITFWKEKIQDGVIYMSNPNRSQFGRNNKFLKSFKHYKHYRD